MSVNADYFHGLLNFYLWGHLKQLICAADVPKLFYISFSSVGVRDLPPKFVEHFETVYVILLQINF